MAGPRDRYDTTMDPRRAAADDARRRGWQVLMQEGAAVHTVECAIRSADAATPGTFANTVLQSFVATDPAYDYSYRVGHRYFSWRHARDRAWLALAGALAGAR